jgi:hypothetical protein
MAGSSRNHLAEWSSEAFTPPGPSSQHPSTSMNPGVWNPQILDGGYNTQYAVQQNYGSYFASSKYRLTERFPYLGHVAHGNHSFGMGVLINVIYAPFNPPHISLPRSGRSRTPKRAPALAS